MDAEARALSRSRSFRSLLREGRAASARPLEEVEADLKLTQQERALADEYLSLLGRLEQAQGAEVTDSQAHLVNVVLVAAEYLKNGRSLADWSAYAGIAESEIRAGALVLEAVREKATPAGSATR